VDYIVELIAPSSKIICHFFVQVKTTREGYTRHGNRLKVKISDKDTIRLAALPVPTYVVGVDEVSEVAYLVSANGRHTKGLSSISTQFPINEQTQEALFQEVVSFWRGFELRRMDSVFVDEGWR
jgi:hypothetical protein